MCATPSKNDPLRVGYVLKKYPRLSETFILNELLGLEGAGCELTVLSLRLPDEGRFQREVADFRGDVVYVPDHKSTSWFDLWSWVADQPEMGERVRAVRDFVQTLPEAYRTPILAQGLHVARQAKNRRLEHLHAHFMTIAAHVACVAHLLTRIPFTVTTHAKDLFRHGVDRNVFRATARHAASLITVCDYNARFLRTEQLVDSDVPVARIYNGLPLDELPTRSPEPRERDLVLGVGRLVEKKGFDALLHATRTLLDRGESVRVVILGDGEAWSDLQLLRRQLGLEDHVQLLGAKPRDEVLRWMGRARLLAAPCRVGDDGNRDALPTVLIEALAMGLPAVTTEVTGIPEILDHGAHGLILRNPEPAGLADAIGSLLADDALCHRLSEAGQIRARERFDRNHTLQQALSLFLQSRNGAPAGARS